MVVTISGEADVTVSLIFQILLLCGCCHSSLGAAPSRACSSQLLRVSSGAGAECRHVTGPGHLQPPVNITTLQLHQVVNSS